MRTDKIALGGLIATLLLSGVALTSSGCAGDRYQRSTGTYLDDKGITARVKTALFRDPMVSGFDVKVNTFRGDVQLNGFVDTAEQKERAASLAREVPGVAMVTNNLEVKPAADTAVGTSGTAVEGRSGTIYQPVPDHTITDRTISDTTIEKQVAPVRTPVPERTPGTALDRDASDTSTIRSSDQVTPVPDRTSTLNSNLDARLGADNLRIDAANGRATLRGTVTSENEKREIERRVRDIPGITSVDNQLDVRNPSSR